MRFAILMLSLFVALGTTACDSGSGSGGGDDPDVAAQQDAGATAPDADPAGDTGPVGAGDAGIPTGDGAGMPGDAVTNMPQDAGQPGPDPAAYPEGPYGKSKFDIIENLYFFDPWANEWIYLSDIYQRPEVKMLIVVSAAGWCSACKLEAVELVDYYTKYKADGLEILYTMYEDPQGLPIFKGPETTSYSMPFMNDWKYTYGVNYPLVADPDFLLESYFTAPSTPLTMVVTTDNMMIRYIDQGYSEAFIQYQILMHLYN